VPRYDIPKAAPDALREVQLFINSVDLHNEVEWLPEWLDERGLGTEYERARGLREALRSLVLANNGFAPDADALQVVNHALESVSLALDSCGRLVLRGNGDAIDEVVRSVAGAMLDGSWERLKACVNCHWCFYDYSPNRSATWCSMQICGNRKKTREYRRRRATSTRVRDARDDRTATRPSRG
jgi:predicted RNA-binding Zn ribbon-like protein